MVGNCDVPFPLPSLLPSSLPSFLPACLHSFLPFLLPFFLPSILSFLFFSFFPSLSSSFLFSFRQNLPMYHRLAWELSILLPQPLKHGDYRCVPPHPRCKSCSVFVILANFDLPLQDGWLPGSLNIHGDNGLVSFEGSSWGFQMHFSDI